ncbi:MAG: PASTA domain-containing protein, partial [Clostridia bacterium]|nr:PASTA domain-containing protein [Clostridia bacterium]
MLNFDRLCPGCMKDNAGNSVCSICGYDSAKGNAPDKLPVRFIIRDRYFVGRTLYSNSESTIYLGFDSIENKAVNIKEYFPAGLAQRNPDKTVFVPREAQLAFNEGLLDFISVNKKLIGFPLQSLPATYTVFEENSTAYAICDTVQGITLKSFLSRNGGTLKWEQVRPLILPLIDTLKALHDMSLIEGDISPDTVMVCRDGKLRIYGVSAIGKRVAKSGNTAAFTTLLHDGYAAAEQYGALHEGVGEYTDVYGICATIFTAVTGIVPPPANERLKADTLKIPAHFADELPRQVLVSLANGMQVKPSERTDSIETLKNELIYGETKENIRKNQRAADAKRKPDDAAKGENVKKGSGLKYAAIASGITACIFLLVAVILVFTVFKDQVFKKAEENMNNNASMPSQQQIGDYDSEAVESKVLYTVPDLRGKFYVEIEKMKELDHFEVVIKNKEYSNTYERGKICSQSIDPGTSKEHGTVIEIAISLGTHQVRMPGIVGLTEQEAQIELLKIGLLYNNIEIAEKYDSNSKPGIV